MNALSGIVKSQVHKLLLLEYRTPITSCELCVVHNQRGVTPCMSDFHAVASTCRRTNMCKIKLMHAQEIR